MWFDLNREERFPTQYAPNETPVTVDVLEAGFITAFIIILFSFIISIPSVKSIIIWRYFRVIFLLVIGLFLLLANFGQEWEVGYIISKTPYKAGIAAEIKAQIGLKIGLRSVNVTLKSVEELNEKLQSEIINYNERFSWEWDQGRFGFGPYAGVLQQEFRAAQYRGLPLPILWVMDYFVIDGEGFRFGRFYRTAGWYTHIVLWCAFTSWIFAVIFFGSVICYGAISLGLCGVLQLLANVLWSVIRNPTELDIPFEDGVIRTKYGFSFWINCVSGIMCLSVAIIIMVVNYLKEEFLYTVFELNPLKTTDEAVITKSEQANLRNRTNKATNNMQLLEMGTNNEEDESEEEYVSVMRRKTVFNQAPPVPMHKKPSHLMRKPI